MRPGPERTAPRAAGNLSDRPHAAQSSEEPLPAPDTTDSGPYARWVEPLLLAVSGQKDAARAALRELPDPPTDHLLEAMWFLVARAAALVDDGPTLERARNALATAHDQLPGAATGILTMSSSPTS